MASNFDFMVKYWPNIAQLGKTAELYVFADADSCFNKLGLLAEYVAQELCIFEKINLPEKATHADRIRAMKYADILPKRIDDIFYALRKAGNEADHNEMCSQEKASVLLQMAFNLCCWMMKVYGDWDFSIPEFLMPENNTQQEDFKAIAQTQEEKLNSLAEMAEEIHTRASDITRKDRAEKADQVALELPLTDMEISFIKNDPIRLDVVVLPALNYAMQQNGTAAIRSVSIENTTNDIIENVDLKIEAIPAFALSFTRHIDYLPANKSITISQPRLILNGEYLAGMTEKVTGVLRVTLENEAQVLACDNAETTVLAYDEWHGIGLYPELLASFVTPNHPDLAHIIARATEFMGNWTGDTSMDGYQSQDPNRVLAQAAAIFTALKEKAIAYVNPPASFERTGQRVRLCDVVLQQKLGTCLDLALLYASCLEAVGLHPILITTTGHVFAGLWLEDQMFPECVQDDFSLITKRLASGVNEIAVIETTMVTTGHDYSFDEARRQGENNLTRMPVEYIIDVHRARMSQVLPLPQRFRTAAGWTIQHDATIRRENMTAPIQLGETIDVDTPANEENIPKKVQWERKLLDLGLRNTLINLRITKTQLPLLTSSLDELEDALADGSEFTILPKPAEINASELDFDKLNEIDASGLIQAEFKNNRLRSILTETELNKTIKELYRTAKTALEENGANTLYLALGMLRWFENKRSTKARYAPIILVPVEIVRKSAVQGYVIRLRDDEPQMNVTLLEKMKQDFGIVINGVDPLPADEHGIDIRRVLTILRKAVMEQPHWDVLETASIGIFSFSQFVMWNDIRNRTDDLMQNKVVRSLIEGKLCWDAQPMEIGDKVDENNVLLPMPADASQLYAIRAACSGESFVLHGPPGTGKSQTITSLIANALAQGRSVLFVAEKMAALEVVQKRLDRIGIGPFCLEVHSNKSRKKDVLEQLRIASEVTKAFTAEEYAAKAEQIAAMRSELDVYADQLHKIQKCGCTLYTLINDYEQYKYAAELSAFDRKFIANLTKTDIEAQQIAVERMIAAAEEVGNPCSHPLRRVACTQYNLNIRSDLRPVTDNYIRQIEAMSGPVEKLSQALNKQQPCCMDDLQWYCTAAENLTCWYEMPEAWVKADDPQHYFEDVIALTRHALSANYLEQQLLTAFDPGFLTQDGAQLFAQFAQASSAWFLPKAIGLNKLAKLINVYARTPINKNTLKDHIVTLRDYQTESKASAELFERYGQDLGRLYQGKATDWNKIAELAARAQASAQALYNLQGSYELMQRYGGESEIKDAVLTIRNGTKSLTEAKTNFDQLLDIIQKEEMNWLDKQLDLCHTILNNSDELKEWIAYMAAANQVKMLGLGNVAAAYETADSIDVFAAYKKALLQGLITHALDESDTLNQFSGTVFNEKIRQYKRMDDEWSQLSQQEVYCRLASKVPNFTREAAQSSELGILKRCIKSGGRGTSIRKLFDQIPNLLPRLCPCMLMSPISAAQYLDPKREPFDIVVFDEASQLPTCKAVGVLARGKNAVIVGDPKQMPPTSFFSTNTADEDNLEVEDLESILDDCLALNMPQSHLLWHYRSRHESLIAFSNSQFYENKLYTFPSVNDRESKVTLVHVDGVFDRGKTRTNRAEAEAVVEEIKRRCKDPELSKQSLGVVTFNIFQQHLIDDLLNESCAGDPELEKWAYGTEEPLFIKNLENVQGDERDVILFSIGFGPDETGKVFMNFGPLNRDGGWRRLNVAVSRARCEMMVFATLQPEQMDLNRTKAEGVVALRSFLEYAQGRSLALSEAELQTRQDSRDGIAVSICNALEEKGYETDLSVGRSEYRIDIGVIDPENKEKYLLGIMLDGSTYGTAKTTRDREIAQISVLEGLGWNILRVWCVDWLDNPSKEIKRILSKLQEIESKAETKEPEPEPESVVPALPAVKLQAKAPASMPTGIKVAPFYKAAVLSTESITAEEFTDPKYRDGIQRKIEQVIAEEAPVSQGTLVKRVVQSYGITRAGSRIQGYIDKMLRVLKPRATQQEDVIFYWQNEQDPADYIGYRVNNEGDNRRDVLEVPVQEIANAIHVVLYEQISMAQEDLLRETARKLGYTRLGGNVLNQLGCAIRYSEAQECITLGMNGAYVLTGKGTTRAEATLQSFN